MKKIITIICAMVMLTGGFVGFVKYREWNEEETTDPVIDNQPVEQTIENTTIAEIKTTIIETSVDIKDEAIEPTGFQGTIQNYCLFHDGGIYFPMESNYVSECPSLKNAILLGEIEIIDNNNLPDRELQAAQFDVGDKVYELNGDIYVIQKTHYHKMYRAEADDL